MLALRDLMRPVGDHNALQPACPICSRPLRLTRVTPRDGDLAELRTYGCTGCGVWLTEAADETQYETQDRTQDQKSRNGSREDDKSH
jgi:hypothetical protein